MIVKTTLVIFATGYIFAHCNTRHPRILLFLKNIAIHVPFAYQVALFFNILDDTQSGIWHNLLQEFKADLARLARPGTFLK